MATKKASAPALGTTKQSKEKPVAEKKPVNQLLKSKSPDPSEALQLPIASAQAAVTPKAKKPAKKAVPVKKATAEEERKPATESATQASDKELPVKELPVKELPVKELALKELPVKGLSLNDFRDIASFGSDNLEACTRSGAIMAKGVETLGKEMLEFAQTAVQANFQITKVLLGATTLREIMDVQADYARRNVDNLLSESSKLTEMSVTVANQAFEPLQSRVSVTVDALLKQRAA